MHIQAIYFLIVLYGLHMYKHTYIYRYNYNGRPDVRTYCKGDEAIFIKLLLTSSRAHLQQLLSWPYSSLRCSHQWTPFWVIIANKNYANLVEAQAQELCY